MWSMFKTFLSVAALAMASTAFAQPTTGQSNAPLPEAAPAAGDEASQVRCRSVYQTNSRIPERICRTRAEWDRIEQESREAMERTRRGAGASGD